VVGDVAASYYCLRIGNSILYYIGDFDDRLAKYSPGMLLIGNSIEKSILEGANYFDFLEGDEGSKSRWASGVSENVRFVVFDLHWRGRLACIFIFWTL
jgi:CelD/BcsL family acetyltransferase involved in cellulose biosynthesis